ncbi:MAG: NADH-quinone oxidoreductase subunit H [Bdellovibrionales bacterium RIFOXYD1_FULL_53_11]|nr:MAG: NADH-quinone oxidoreductase subunit H [Bdellovibrionales bacterium RIFOXYD1_FULL_53_11]
MDITILVISAIKVVVIFGAVFVCVPLMTWIERRGAGLMQLRLGPSRLGPLGLFQPIADGIKFLFKEDREPAHVEKFFYFIAPLVCFIAAALTFAVIPVAAPVNIAGRTISFQIADLNVGILYILAISSVGLYGIVMAGWSSNNKYAMIGALRSSAQMISYEIALGLSVIGVVMVFSSVVSSEIIAAQAGTLFSAGPFNFPRWGVFLQPIGFLIFVVAMFAETNRLPFDLPEGESEIVAGYHIEYGGLKWSMFFVAEYTSMISFSALAVTLFFGGWQLFPGMGRLVALAPGMWGAALLVVLQILSFTIKTAFFMWFFVWVRWTLPRFRYDQLMALGWKVLMPLAALNIAGTLVLIRTGVL